jgi:hypothetical protein
MKLRYARIITHDVAGMVSLYKQITGINPDIKSDDYVELPTSAGTLALGRRRSMEVSTSA